jgi:hypothetical protein
MVCYGVGMDTPRRCTMFKSAPVVLSAVVLVAILIPASDARGGAFGDVLVGLDFAGFQYTGQNNPLSNGFSASATRNFQNTLLDFGATELTLTGPVGVSLTTSNRGFRTLDFNITAGAPGNPLIYNFVSDTGGTEVNIDGSQVFQVVGSINQFGWYDMRVQLSGRQTVTSTGRFANSDGEVMDFDVGPIDVSGNLFADLLATITDPFYQSAGFENIFASFSGRTARESALDSTVSKLRAKMAAGIDLTSAEVSRLVTLATTAQLHGDDVPALDFLNLSYGDDPQAQAPVVQRAVPEPSTIGMLLLSTWWMTRRRRR